MKIFNFRKYFATNSSSSHSILVLKDLNQVASHVRPKDDYEAGSYGWDNFTLASKEAKESYLAWSVHNTYSQILRKQKDYGSIEGGYTLLDKEAREKTLKLFPHLESEFKDDNSMGIDHQSWIIIPTNYEGTDIQKEYVQELQDYMLQDAVVIAGGNDNDSDTHELKQGKYYTTSILETLPKEIANFSARKSYVVRPDGTIDKEKSFWTLFNRQDGTKYRLAFDDKIKELPKSAAPELADICITDYCTFGCEFCYQDSTLDGKHASFDNLEKIAKALSKAQVQEVAAGGGETTLHPDFNRIVRMFHDHNIVFNFTTKNLAYFKKPENREILSHVGAFAFSVSDSDDVLKLKNMIDIYPELTELASIQYVMGTTPMKEFEEILKTCAATGIKATLLGYKQNGRGQAFESYSYDNWLDKVVEITKNHNIMISIDTQLAGQSQEEMKKHKISPFTFHTKEGAHSVYIDAVQMTFAPSSYVGLEQTKDFTPNWLQDYLHMGAEAQTQKPKRKIKIK